MLLVTLTSRDQSGEIDCRVLVNRKREGALRILDNVPDRVDTVHDWWGLPWAQQFLIVLHTLKEAGLCYILPSFRFPMCSFRGGFCLIYSIKEKQRATGQDRIFHSCLYCRSLCGTGTSIPKVLKLVLQSFFFRGNVYLTSKLSNWLDVLILFKFPCSQVILFAYSKRLGRFNINAVKKTMSRGGAPGNDQRGHWVV